MFQQKTINISAGKVTLIEPGIIKLWLKNDMVFDVTEFLEGRKANLILSEGEPFCVLLDSENYFASTPEARVLAASEKYSKERIALAGMVKSLADRIAGNFFIKFNKPASPTRLFTNEEEAINWLRMQRDAFKKRSGILLKKV